jgi:hypothetical protein
MPISIESAQATLQKYFVLCAGVPCDTVLAPPLAARVAFEGHWGAVTDLVNGYLGAQAATLGAAALVVRMADQAFGLHLSDADAQAYAARVSSGEMTWAGLAEWALTLEGPLGQTLANRAQVAQMFTNELQVAQKAHLWSVDGIRGAAQTLLHGVTADPASTEHACECLSALVANMSAGGVQAQTTDGYLAGATVFVDANGNGILDIGEFATTTDASGNFSIPRDAPHGRLIAFGGIDLLTGAPFHGRLSAPAGAAVATPFTTLVSSLIDAGVVQSAQAGADLLLQALHLPAGVNLMTYDPIALLAARQDVDHALAVQKVAVEVTSFLSNATIALHGALSVSAPQAFDLIAGALAGAIAAGGTFDLTSPQALAHVITDAAQSALGAAPGAALATVIQQLADLLAAQNAAAGHAGSIFDLAQSAAVSLTQLPDALQDAFLLGGDLQQLVAGFTGAELAARIGAATVGELVPGLAMHEAQVHTLAFGGTVGGGVPEVQTIALYAHTPGAQYELTVGGTVLTTAAVPAGATAADIAAAVQAAPGYAAAPFTVDGPDGFLRLTWKAVGDQTVTAQLQSVLVGAAVFDPDPQDGVTGAPEVQRIATGELSAGARYLLTVGSTVLATAALDGTPTTAELAAALQAAPGYAAAPFTVAASGSELEVTWKADGDQLDVAMLQPVVVGAAVTDPHPLDGSGTPEIQTLAPGALIAGASYELTVGAAVLTTGALDANPTGEELAAALQACAGYGAAAFTVAANGSELVVTWKAIGDQADVAELRSIVTGAPMWDADPVDGTPGTREIQTIPVAESALTAGGVYAMSVGDLTLTAAALDADPTVAELAAALRAASGYASAPFTLEAGGDNLVLTWKEPGDQGVIAQLSGVVASEPVSSTTVQDGRGSGKFKYEVQSFDAASLSPGEAYLLAIGATTLTTQPLDASPTVTELVSAFQVADGYATAPATVGASGTDLTLTWRTGGNQPDGAAQMYHVLSTEVATGATTTNGTGSQEVQAIAAGILDAGACYQLSVGAVSLLTAPMDGDPTVAELVAALRADVAYAAAPFTLSAAGSDLVVTWKALGDQQDIASLSSIVTSAPVTDPAPIDGAAGAVEVQSISASGGSLLGGARYLLAVGDTSLLTEALDANPTTGELVAALQAAPGYATAAFTIAQSGSNVELTWKTDGDQAVVAELRTVLGAGPALGDADPQDGVLGSAEIQGIAAAAPFAGAQYRLTVGDVTLTSAALDGDPTTAELAAALCAASGYDAAPFTVAASGTDLQVTWKVAGDQLDVAQLRAVVACGQGSSFVDADGEDDGFAVSDAPMWAPHVVDDMMPGDRIDLTTATHGAVVAPVSLTRVADVASSDNMPWTTLVAFEPLGPNEAGLLVVKGGLAAGTYLYADNGNGTVDWAEDVLVELVGVVPGPVGPLAVADYFA